MNHLREIINTKQMNCKVFYSRNENYSRNFDQPFWVGEFVFFFELLSNKNPLHTFCRFSLFLLKLYIYQQF
jgi:hypothetical protein